MAYAFDKMMKILNKLEASKRVTAKLLASELEVSERQIYRYFDTLQLADFPIFYDRKRQTYAFVEGFSLKKLELSVEEQLSLALAKHMLKSSGIGMEQGLQKIEDKLLFKGSDLPGHIIIKSDDTPQSTQGNLEALHEAISDFHRITIHYRTLYSDEVTVRTIDPYYFFFKQGFWYLRGYCHTSCAMRTFGIDRIIRLDVLDEYFVPKNISPQEELSDSFGTYLDGELTEIVLLFDKDYKQNILRKKWHHSQTERELDDGRLEVRFHVKGINGIKKWLYQWIPHVEVIDPHELKQNFIKEIKHILRKHEKATNINERTNTQ